MKKFVFFFFCLTQITVGQTVTQFLPELFNRFPNVRDFAMDNDQQEIYFTVESYKKRYAFIAYTTKDKNGQWVAPKAASFSGKYRDLEPFLAPDGLTLYFASNRIDNTSETIKKDVDIWYVTRKTKSDSWSEPKNIGTPINTNANEFYPSVTAKGDLFFTAQYPNSKGKEDIYVSRYIDEKYTTPTSLSAAINSEKYEFNAFVAPDESYIIFTSYGRKDDTGRGDLYISRKDAVGNWLPAQNLGKLINSNTIDYCPFVDITSNTLYFTSDRNDIQPKLKTQKSLVEIIQQMNTSPNGLSRVYKVSLNKK